MGMDDWRDAAGARYREIKPGYRVGDDGSVWSCVEHAGPGKCVLTDRWHRLKPRPTRGGYLRLRVGHRREECVHRLVLGAFVGPCPPGQECRHLDGDPGNNRLENLAWGTHPKNMEDAVRHGTAYMKSGAAHPNAKLAEADVLEALALHRAGVGTRGIGRWLGVTHTTIGNILHGRRWGHVTGLPTAQANDVT